MTVLKGFSDRSRAYPTGHILSLSLLLLKFINKSIGRFVKMARKSLPELLCFQEAFHFTFYFYLCAFYLLRVGLK